MYQPTNVAGLRFDEDLHLYEWNGRIVPGVNEIFEAFAMKEPFMKLSTYHTQRGKDIHELTALQDRGQLPPELITEDVAHQLAEWSNYRKQHNRQIILIEQVLIHPKLLYCGTLDRVEYDEPTQQLYIIDLKPKSNRKLYTLQLSAYACALTAMIEDGMLDLMLPAKSIRRIYLRSVHLPETGHYKVQPHAWMAGAWEGLVECYNFLNDRR